MGYKSAGTRCAQKFTTRDSIVNGWGELHVAEKLRGGSPLMEIILCQEGPDEKRGIPDAGEFFGRWRWD
jgi:hypothetical protein